MELPFIPAADVFGAVRPAEAVAALQDVLRSGLDPAADPDRVQVGWSAGQLLAMPAEFEASAGVKLATVSPGNGVLGLPRIQGVYLLMDSATLTPLALLDGPALTTLRTPAVSVAAVLECLAAKADPLRVIVIGTGPQGAGHVATLVDALPPGRVAQVTYLVRRPVALREDLVHVRDTAVLMLGAPAAEAELACADVVVCATSAAEPVFRSAGLKPDVVVMAVGSHEPDKRELDSALMASAQVVVEDVRTVLREAGDVVIAVREGVLAADSLITLADVVTGRVALDTRSPIVFKSTGMSWEDLVVAQLVHDRWAAARGIAVAGG